MTLLLRRKRRTTVRSTTLGTRAVKALLFLALVTTTAVGQPPGSALRTPASGGTQQPAGQAGAGTQSAGQPAAQSNTLSNGLTLPPGYRPRTPPPQAAQPSRPISSAATPGSAGTMMYFQKPADALTATGGGLPAASDGVAQLGAREPVVPVPVPDAAPVRPTLPPIAAAPDTLALPVPTGIAAQPEAQPLLPKTQPGDMTTPKVDLKTKDVDPKLIRLPPRDKIFGIAYNDTDLERAIMDDARQDMKRQKIYTPNLEADLVFPPLPVVNPSGAAYQPKTVTYAPRKLFLEPGYVVHRRLGFEQQNFERAGWDMGPLTTLVSAGQFYRSVLLWPQTLASGCAFGFWDTSAGKCLPGSPSPYYLYPPNLTVTGGLAEAGIITGFSFLFP